MVHFSIFQPEGQSRMDNPPEPQETFGTKHRQQTNKANITAQKNKKMSNTDLQDARRASQIVMSNESFIDNRAGKKKST